MKVLKQIFSGRQIIYALCLMPYALVGCSRPDPILPGHRTPIFGGTPTVINTSVPDIGEIRSITEISDGREFVQDNNNVIWEVRGDDRTRVFSGMPIANQTAGTRTVRRDNQNIYAGLSTGEFVAINKNTRRVVWMADIFQRSAITGGAPILDIIAPAEFWGDSIIVGGMGNAMCRLRTRDGRAIWCNDISVGRPFITTTTTSFVVATSNYLYAIDNATGQIFWRTSVRRNATPNLAGGVITVDRERFDATTGTLIRR